MPFRIDEAVQACIIQEQEVVHAVAILAKQGVVIILNVEKIDAGYNTPTYRSGCVTATCDL